MTLIFNIEYRTSCGEEVRVLGSIPELGNNQPNKATPLHTVDGIHWTAEVDIQIPGNGSANTVTTSIEMAEPYGQSGTACHASCTLQTIRRKFTA